MLALLVIVVVKFNAKANPVPSRTTHNTLIEVAWTLIPVLILVAIAVPSFRLLFQQLDIPKADLTVKATGKQWYWSYAYPDNGKFEFDSLLAQDKQPRLLGVDNEMVVPVNKVIRVQTTGADVIHAFAVPAFGIKIDSIPGRLNETWFKATKVGMYYGQCSELCGKDHAFMPIAVRVVNDQEFAAWVEAAKKKFATNPANTFASAGVRPRSKARPGTSKGQGRRDLKGSEKGLQGRISKWQRPQRHTTITPMTTTRMPIRPDGGAGSIRRTIRTSARCTLSSRSSRVSSVRRCRSRSASS